MSVFCALFFVRRLRRRQLCYGYGTHPLEIRPPRSKTTHRRRHRGLLLHSSNTLSLAAYSVFSGTPRSNNLVSKSSFSDSFKMLITRTFSKSSRLAPPVALLAHSKYSSS